MPETQDYQDAVDILALCEEIDETADDATMDADDKLSLIKIKSAAIRAKAEAIRLRN